MKSKYNQISTYYDKERMLVISTVYIYIFGRIFSFPNTNGLPLSLSLSLSLSIYIYIYIYQYSCCEHNGFIKQDNRGKEAYNRA